MLPIHQSGFLSLAFTKLAHALRINTNDGGFSTISACATHPAHARSSLRFLTVDNGIKRFFTRSLVNNRQAELIQVMGVAMDIDTSSNLSAPSGRRRVDRKG